MASRSLFPRGGWVSTLMTCLRVHPSLQRQVLAFTAYLSLSHSSVKSIWLLSIRRNAYLGVLLQGEGGFRVI